MPLLPHRLNAESVSEHGGTEEMLRLLNSAVFQSKESILITDAQLDLPGPSIVFVNPAFTRMTGYTANEVLGKTPRILQGLRTDKAVLSRLRRNLERGEAFEGETINYRKDGTEFMLEWQIAPIRDSSGNITHFVATQRDITVRKQSEITSNRLAAIVESSEDAIIGKDLNGIIGSWNKSAERIFGYSATEMIGTPIIRLIPADRQHEEDQILEKIRRGQSVEHFETVRQTKDGRFIDISVTASPIRDSTGNVVGASKVARDITVQKLDEVERKKLDQRLRDQQFYTRSLIESNIDALMSSDPLGIITDVNEQMEALTGCTRDELIGAPFKNCFTDAELADAAIKLVLSKKKVINYELTARARDGKETVVSYNATTFYDRDHKLQGVFAAARDITERKQFEQALQKSNVELESAKFVADSAKVAADTANLAKSDFLSSMSHELRSPLNAILGFAQLMESAVPLPTATQAARIAQILQAGWHLLKLINEILDLAVIESGQVSMSMEHVSLAEVMAECRSMMEPQAQQRGIQMTFPRFDNPLFVRVDRTRLKQIVINLLSNAIKYNKDKGAVVVDCIVSAPERIRISFKDTGAGLSPEKLAQLFQPFNRLGQEASGVTGTGIGLIVTKRLAELMGGVLGVESTPGAGSVFWCELTSTESPDIKIADGEVETFVRPQ